jgi:acetylornithine/N-succinyldiaminopimelate aminotransferase
LTQIRQICDENNWLLIIDEVQTGVARTGRWFAHQHEGVTPDVMTLAKGLGSGVPVGALLTHDRANDVFHIGAHGTTFGGNPLAMAAGLATLAAIEDEGLLDNAQRQGVAIRDGLSAALADEISAGLIMDIRGRGLMIGIELARPCTELVKQALAVGLLINVTHDTVVRLLPPLIINDEESAELVQRLSSLIKVFLSHAS